MMYVMSREKLELLRETIANDEQPQAKDDYEKDCCGKIVEGTL
jgi:hypothetical protein